MVVSSNHYEFLHFVHNFTEQETRHRPSLSDDSYNVCYFTISFNADT